MLTARLPTDLTAYEIQKYKQRSQIQTPQSTDERESAEKILAQKLL
jgi:hypothetical protein